MHRPLLKFVIFFILGIFVSSWIKFPFKISVLANVSCLLLSFLFLKQKRISVFFLILGFILFGHSYVSNYRTLSIKDVNHIARYYSRPIILEGIIASDVTERKFYNRRKLQFNLKVKRFLTSFGWQDKTGVILVNLFGDHNLSYGDYVLLEGKIHRPFDFKNTGAFSYKDYLKARGIHYVLSVKTMGRVEVLNSNQGLWIKGFSLFWRNKFKSILSYHLTDNEAGIMQAILIGDRSKIPKHIRELFVRTGTAHILAISGLHIGIVSALFFVFLKLSRIPLKLQYFLTIVLIIAYALLTGGRPSVIRATIMTVVFLFAFLLERETDSIHSLALAALILLLLNPFHLFDIGFQLSFVSVLGILLIFPKIMKRIESHNYQKVIHHMATGFVVSMAAWLGVLGLVAYYFNIITPISLLANLIIVPLMFLVVGFGLGVLFFGLLVPILAGYFAVCLKLTLSVMILFVYIIDKVPLGHVYLKDVSLWHVISYYALVGLLVALLHRTAISNKFGRNG